MDCRRLALLTLLCCVCVASTRLAAQQQPQPPAQPPAQAPTTPPAPIRVGGNVRAPTRTRNVPPVYPPEAQRAGIQGTVIIEATIGEDGKVREAIVRRSIPQLDQPAVDAVRQWEFTPTIVNGKAVPIIMTVTVQFALANKPNAPATPFDTPGMILLGLNPNSDGTTTVWQIPQERAAALPRWDPETQSPSLAVVDAVRLGRAWVMQRDADVPRLDLELVNLHRPPRAPNQPFWYYQLAFSGSRAATPQARQVFQVVVLSDGSIVEPVIVNRSLVNGSAESGSVQR